MIITKGLEDAQIDAETIGRYESPVRAAWEQFLSERKGRQMMAMTFWLGLKDPRDPSLVTVAVGIDAKYGRVSATTPQALQASLLKHLLDRFPDEPAEGHER